MRQLDKTDGNFPCATSPISQQLQNPISVASHHGFLSKNYQSEHLKRYNVAISAIPVIDSRKKRPGE